MPSPTSSTLPTSRASSCPRYCSISVCNTEKISSALNLMTASRYKLVPNRLEPGANRGVIQPIAHAHDHATEQLRIDRRLQDRVELQGLAQLLPQAIFLVVRQRHGRAHLHANPLGPRVPQFLGRRQDWAKQVQSLVLVQHFQKVHEQDARLVLKHLVDDLRFAFPANGAA